ncbi:interactor of constitutive active ROPs 3-like [Abrus precatorius]|uniref:Interactor of constitutive active ROPs 3-like n=1 Tax=Abrus precatorius TaxID=3816 RepID=A0A8B8KZ94_ABRPR|nr:interactor of constitutive active ROPs 3-like [Abrus precatorius]
MQTPKTRSGSSEVPQKVSPRAVRQLKTASLDNDSVSSVSQATKLSKERSPKVSDRRSPRSPVPERKRPSRISELESQISQLQDDLKVVRDQLILSESCKKQGQKDAEESKEQLLALSAKLEDSQKQVMELCAAGEARILELQKIIEERDMACQSELEVSKKQLSVDSHALASAMNEVQLFKTQLELVANHECVQTQHAESTDMELLTLKQNLSEALSLVDSMKNKLRDCKESEAQAQALVNATMLQLEAAKGTVEFLRADVAKAVDGYNSIALELEQSKAKVNSLEALVRKLEKDPINNKCNHSENLADDQRFEHQDEILKEGEHPNYMEAEIISLKSEVGRLKSAIDTAESKYQEEQIRSTVQIRNAYELVEQIKYESGERECELEAELNRNKADIEELKANLMDKETELQGIVEENENLSLKLEKSMLSQNEHELRKEIKRLEEHVAELKADMMDKETTLQSISEENEMLKLEINKRFSDGGKVREEVAAEVEGAKAAKREAIMKLGIVLEEADRSNKKAARVVEQLEAAQGANLEMEAELRRLKVQSDQWRKAAEAAAAMLSAGNSGKLTERTVSLDNNYKCSPYADDMMDDEFQRKKNGNMLKKIGVLWKKPQKQ